MFDQLSVPTRTVIRQLLSSEPVDAGGKKVDPFREEEARLLYAVADNLTELSDHSGKDLADRVVSLWKKTKLPEQEDPSGETKNGSEAPTAWKLGMVRTCSYRGLAPAGMRWEHDFEKQSFLIFGPNGSGKSSLLGAIAWCLTGKVFRDDRQPSEPERVNSYTTGSIPRKAGERPDALALTEENGHSTVAETEYWVEIQLVSEHDDGGSKEVWIRRSSANGLKKSSDGQTWTEIQGLFEVGIGELDAELHLLMPARAPYVSFGKNRNLADLLSALVGLHDLQKVIEVTKNAATQCTRNANDLRRKQLDPKTEEAEKTSSDIQAQAPAAVRILEPYSRAFAASRSVDDVKALDEELKGLLDKLHRKLESDLGLPLSHEVSGEDSERRKKLEDLPGHVQVVLDSIGSGLDNLFSSSVGLSLPDSGSLDSLKTELDSFEKSTRLRIKESLDWAKREAENEKLSLFIEAAKYFPEDSTICPVCEQDLADVPQVKQKLESLRRLAVQPHVTKAMEDLDRELRDELGKIVDANVRSQGRKSFRDRLAADWQDLQTTLFPGLLISIQKRFDNEVDGLVKKLPRSAVQETLSLLPDNSEAFSNKFLKVQKEFDEARAYIALAFSTHEHRDTIKPKLASLFMPSSEGGAENSLGMVLQSGRNALSEIKNFESMKRLVQSLVTSLQEQEKTRVQIDKYSHVADAAKKVKSLSDLVRKQVISVIGTVEERMKKHYASLYPQETLVLDKVTTGHAANPDIKGEVNAYLLAGDEHVPIGPFSNAGRLRALVWSLIFALLDQSRGSLGFIILDDPAQSLDDEHKTRLVDNLIARLIAEQDVQVITATHYKNFFKLAKPGLPRCCCVQMHPRRGNRDTAGFEPSDELVRLQDAIDKNDCSWQDVNIRIRTWVERVLKTLSSYSPEPFLVFNNIPDTIAAYKHIDDTRIATGKRDEIVRALRSPQVLRVINWVAHDEDLSRQDVADALNELKDCRKHCDAEIKRLKDLNSHRLVGRGLQPSPRISCLPVKAKIPDLNLDIVAEAAAASEGKGIEFMTFSSERLCCNAAVVLKGRSLAPIARPGQYLLLAREEQELRNGDIVVARTESGEHYARRYWAWDRTVSLENANPTDPGAPELLESGSHHIRKVVGVLFEGLPGVTEAEHKEWFQPDDFPVTRLEDCKGVRVDGASMEPIARDGQIVLIRPDQQAQEINCADLACIDIEEEGVVIKRCYPGEFEWTLLPVNPNQPEDPMRIPSRRIRNWYPLAGILFETSSLTPQPTT